MTDLITDHTDYESFARERHSETLNDYSVSLNEARERGLLNEQDTRQLWQLLGLLSENDLFVQIPEWLAEKKVRVMDRSTPTTFVGHVTRETEDAILFENSAPARPLMRLAHGIHSLKRGIENTGADDDRREGLENRLREKRREFENRDDASILSDEWLPKSQLIAAVQRSD
ncbi:hypothetical protein [Haladaptatus salinisoli]|uniref:hypothetical protein n=1 Tax=Haladaptatus salinisoli TaxID=2884876 RepID=UPI001D0B05B0|nr:hypothetical protein [Haladaptatus salinisoli]